LKVFWFFFSKKNKHFFCEQSRANAPDGKKQKTSFVLAVGSDRWITGELFGARH